VVLLRYAIDTVCDYGSLSELVHKRLRWIVVMRHMRPLGHLGLLLTTGLFWAMAAVAVHPTPAVAIGYLGVYMGMRMAMTWTIGIRGLGQSVLWKEMLLIPVWDGLAFALWLTSFGRNTIRWRGADYRIRDGRLIPVLLPNEHHTRQHS
jgi:ceramide glucosyltransferase